MTPMRSLRLTIYLKMVDTFLRFQVTIFTLGIRQTKSVSTSERQRMSYLNNLHETWDQNNRKIKHEK